MRYSFWTVLSLVLLALGVLFYLVMGIAHGSWTDTGVYAVTLMLVGFGALGAYASSLETAEAS